MIKEKEVLIGALSTLFHSWGSDTPDEVYWGANELLDWFEKQFNVKISRFVRDEKTWEENFEDVMEEIRNL